MTKPLCSIRTDLIPSRSMLFIGRGEQLENSEDAPSKVDDRWTFLSELPRRHDEGNYLFVHGSPREPTNEYVFPEDVYDSRKMDTLFAKFDLYCFQGHTHMPGVFSPNGDFVSPEECDYEYHLTDDKAMVNVGSVGQPRDGDPRACYTILDDETEHFDFSKNSNMMSYRRSTRFTRCRNWITCLAIDWHLGVD